MNEELKLQSFKKNIERFCFFFSFPIIFKF